MRREGLPVRRQHHFPQRLAPAVRRRPQSPPAFEYGSDCIKISDASGSKEEHQRSFIPLHEFHQ